MFHANFHGDFFNLSKITFFCFDLSNCLPPRRFFGVVLPVTPCWIWASFAPTLGQSVMRLLKRLWRLYQLVPPQCPIPFFLFLSLSLASPLCNRVLGFLSHDGFIGGPLLKRFHFSPDPFSLVLSAAWHIKGDLWVIEPWTQNIKSSACLAASKHPPPPPSHHLPSSSFKWQKIVSLSYRCILKAFNF